MSKYELKSDLMVFSRAISLFFQHALKSLEPTDIDLSKRMAKTARKDLKFQKVIRNCNCNKLEMYKDSYDVT